MTTKQILIMSKLADHVVDDYEGLLLLEELFRDLRKEDEKKSAKEKSSAD
jgi:hypothetical protein